MNKKINITTALIILSLLACKSEGESIDQKAVFFLPFLKKNTQNITPLSYTTPDKSFGALIYQDSCSGCHGADGSGGSSGVLLTLPTCVVCGNFDDLVLKIHNDMPKNNPIFCRNQCAADVAIWIFDNFTP